MLLGEELEIDTKKMNFEFYESVLYMKFMRMHLNPPAIIDTLKFAFCLQAVAPWHRLPAGAVQHINPYAVA